MVSLNTLCKNILNVKDFSLSDATFVKDPSGVLHFIISVQLDKNVRNICPVCGRKCSAYDSPQKRPSRWRALDWNGVIVEIECSRSRVCCPEHGVRFAAVPWAYEGSRFTKDFDRAVAWMACRLPKSSVAAYMRINWATVGRCISRTRDEIEPDPSVRFDNLVHIGIDETSYRKGHKYLTVVVDHDTGSVVWAGDKHGKEVLSGFFKLLTPEQRASIRIVTGDGARWITECVEEYLPNCERCVDTFHVVEWANAAADTVRLDSWRDAVRKAEQLRKETPRTRGRPPQGIEPTPADKAEKFAREIKGAGYALGKAPENLTENQRRRIEIIQVKDKRLYRAYVLKESLRLILHMPDAEEAAKELKGWLWRASHSRITAFCELYRKIKRHKDHILNTIRYGLSNALVESVNNKIKLLIRKAYGFRNVQHMLDMILIVCSELVIPLPNRGNPNVLYC